MRWLIAGVLPLAVVATSGCAGASGRRARAEFVDAQGEKIGTAVLAEQSDGVKISVELRNLFPGVHAFHIHTVGQCHPADFQSAKGHFNPFGKKHGFKNPEGPHAGDLPNFTANTDGSARFEVVANLVTLGSGPNSLFQEEGTCLVIHAGPDDEESDPAGNAGTRIACGVIQEETPPPASPTGSGY